jgi:hypothetical protein
LNLGWVAQFLVCLCLSSPDFIWFWDSHSDGSEFDSHSGFCVCEFLCPLIDTFNSTKDEALGMWRILGPIPAPLSLSWSCCRRGKRICCVA